MARILTIAQLFIALLVALSVFLAPLVVSAAAVLANDEGENEVQQPRRARKCRHISAVHPFPGKNDYSILYPHISEVTMRTHFHSHQVAGYLGKINTWLKSENGGASCPVDDTSLLLHLVRELELTDPLRKSAHQAYNHALYFAMLRKNRTLVEVRPSADDISGYVRVSDGLSLSAAEVGIETDDDDNDKKSSSSAAATPNIVTIHGQTFVDKTHKYNIKSQPLLSAALTKSFGSVKKFKEIFVEKAIGHFASGWVWLMVDPSTGELSIAESHDGDTVNGGHTKQSYEATIAAMRKLQSKSSGSSKSTRKNDKKEGEDKSVEEEKEEKTKKDDAVGSDDDDVFAKSLIDPKTIDGRVPLAVLDVWEHAYYLDFQSKRKDYVEAWFKAVDWSLVEKRLKANDFEVPKSQASPDRDYTYSVFY